MSIKNEFVEFIKRGNVIDLAVAIVIGMAFLKVINSFVEDILMPPLGMLLGKMDFAALQIELSDNVAIRYGAFINTLVNFIIIALAIFFIIKLIKKPTNPGQNN